MWLRSSFTPRGEVNQLADALQRLRGRCGLLHGADERLPGQPLCLRYPEFALLYTETDAAGNTVYLEDRERGYPALIRDVMPVGLLGLALASLMAAFMSTVSTHINWGASYIANDFYKRFFNPNASDARMTWVSRLATIGITLLSAWVATFVDNIGSMWELYGGMMAGLGLPHLMRWFWWRANAWTEIVGMVVGLGLAHGQLLYRCHHRLR